MKKDTFMPKYTLKEELVNSISHGVGAIFSILGLALLIIKSSSQNFITIISVIIFGVSMVLLYTTSALYHALPAETKRKQILRILDHCNVFLLVFGTIMPVSLIGIGGMNGLIYFLVAGAICILGIIALVIKLKEANVIEVLSHFINGWGTILFIKTLINNIGSTGAWLLVLGGIIYSVGAIFYGLGTKKKYMHFAFHIFCMIGTLFHYLVIYLYILK